jgi:hypothetical protein
MTAMRALELPVVELPAELAGGEPEFPAPGRSRESAARRAATRWAQPVPATALVRPGAPARVQARPRTAAAPLRLTRRGRIVAAVLAALVLAGLSLAIALSAQATSQPGPARGVQGLAQVTVLPGQSLWAVAEKADPGADTRTVVQRIVELNSLSGSAVYAGQQLWVPRG